MAKKTKKEQSVAENEIEEELEATESDEKEKEMEVIDSFEKMIQARINLLQGILDLINSARGWADEDDLVEALTTGSLREIVRRSIVSQANKERKWEHLS